MMPANRSKDTSALHLHLGFHKTATTFLQDTLLLNLPTLNAAGVGYVSRAQMRMTFKGRFDQFSSQELNATLAEHAGRSLSRLIVSEENICGRLDSIRTPKKYVRLRHRIARLAAAFPNYKIRVFLGIRPFSDFLPSVYCEYLRRCSFMTFEAFVEPIAVQRLSWYQILLDALQQHVGIRFVIYDFAAFRFIQDRLLLQLSFGELQHNHPRAARSRESFTREQIDLIASDPGEIASLIAQFSKQRHRQGQLFRPFQGDDRVRLLDRYHDDLNRLASHSNVTVLTEPPNNAPIAP